MKREPKYHYTIIPLFQIKKKKIIKSDQKWVYQTNTTAWILNANNYEV